MKRITILLTTALLVLAGCGNDGLGSGSEEDLSNEVVIGGFSIEGPAGREISISETMAEREDVETYVQSVRLIIEESAAYFPRFVEPDVELENETLTVSVGIEALEEARTTVEDGLEALQTVEPPEGLQPVNELLIATHVQAIGAYDNIIDAFESGDVDVLGNAVHQNLPEIEQFNAETRAILLELVRVETVNPDDRVESRG